MTDSLPTYLHDHLAGSKFAIDVLEFLRDQHTGEPLAEFAAALLAELEEERRVVHGILGRAGNGSPVLKEAAAWVGEKVSQFKLRRGAFGTFEALEALALGILGKLAMWRVLAIIAQADARVRGIDFEQLGARAQAQHAQVEEFRLQAARAAFEGADAGGAS